MFPVEQISSKCVPWEWWYLTCCQWKFILCRGSRLACSTFFHSVMDLFCNPWPKDRFSGSKYSKYIFLNSLVTVMDNFQEIPLKCLRNYDVMVLQDDTLLHGKFISIVPVVCKFRWKFLANLWPSIGDVLHQ